MKSVIIAAVALICVIGITLTLTLVTENAFDDMAKELSVAEEQKSGEAVFRAEEIFEKNLFALSLTFPDTMLYEIDASLAEL